MPLQKEIEKAKQNNKITINRLINEYSCEIEKINATKRFYDCLSLPKGIYTGNLILLVVFEGSGCRIRIAEKHSEFCIPNYEFRNLIFN